MGVDMNEVVMLRGAEPREILETAIAEQVPAIMSYLSKGKWHVAKVLLTNLGASRLSVKIWPNDKPRPVNIHIHQPVGVSLKYGYGKFVFDTTVVGLEQSPSAPWHGLPAHGNTARMAVPRKSGDRGQNGSSDSAQGHPERGNESKGGAIVLAVPDRIEIVQRRSYYRVDVPKSLKVNVLLWHRGQNYVPRAATCSPDKQQDGSACTGVTADANDETRDYYQGRLVDISAGGAQIAVDTAQKPDLRKGQFIGLTFTPMPYERPLIFDAQIRNILPTVDSQNICLGLQIVGLEASSEGRQILERLCNVVERYFQINKSGAKQQEMKGPPRNTINPIRNSENQAKPQKGTISNGIKGISESEPRSTA
jgi:hypothetical protein